MPTTATPACSPRTTSPSVPPPLPTARTRSRDCWPSRSRCPLAPTAREITSRKRPPSPLRSARSRLPRGPEMSREFVDPAYGTRSLVDVVPAVSAAIGVPHRSASTDVAGYGDALALPDAPAYVVFLIDGLGALLLERHAHAAPYLSSLLPGQRPGTAGVPSTTATSLTSLGTALPPGSHGLVGFTSRIPGTDRLLNALSWDKNVDPKEWQPHATAFTGLRLNGATVTMVNKREFRD